MDQLIQFYVAKSIKAIFFKKYVYTLVGFLGSFVLNKYLKILLSKYTYFLFVISSYIAVFHQINYMFNILFTIKAM